MAEIVLAPPEPDEIELSLFGPGYGECSVVHAGHGEWIINDSCVRGGSPVALEYLGSLGVDVANDVKLVVASHWHDDHVRGIARIIERCGSAIFACSASLQAEEFLQLVDRAPADLDSLKSGVSEFRKVIDLRRDGKIFDFKFANADQLIWRSASTSSTAHSLSPSTGSVIASHYDIAELVERVSSENIRVPVMSPNHSSVVLWLDFGPFKALLGGDLEQLTASDRGWSAIISSTTRPLGHASVYKVAHHGSETAHNEDIWKIMLDSANISTLTPWRRGRYVLPTGKMTQKIGQLSPAAYITSDKPAKRPVAQTKLADEVMDKAARTRLRMDPPFGHVRLRRRLDENDWRVELSPEAAQLVSTFK